MRARLTKNPLNRARISAAAAAPVKFIVPGTVTRPVLSNFMPCTPPTSKDKGSTVPDPAASEDSVAVAPLMAKRATELLAGDELL